MFKIAALIIKELKIIARDPVGLVMLFFLPTVFILILSVALQGAFAGSSEKEKVNVLISDDDDGDLAEQIAQVLKESGAFHPISSIQDKRVAKDEIRSMVFDGKYRAGIAVPDNASDSLTLDHDATIEVFIDPVLSNEFAYMVKAIVEDVVSMSVISALAEKDRVITDKLDELATGLKDYNGLQIDGFCEDVDTFNETYESRYGIYLKDRGPLVAQIYASRQGDRKMPNEVQQNVPGWTVFALFWIAQLLALNIISERKSGAYKRIMLSSAGLTHYIAGKSIPFIMINIIQAVALFAIGVYVLPLLGCHELKINNIGALALTTIAISLTANGFGILMASISDNDTFAASISAAILIIMSVVGGIMVPKFVMPSLMQQLSFVVPHGWAIECYQDVLIKGFTITQTLPKVSAILAFAFLFFSAGIIKMK